MEEQPFDLKDILLFLRRWSWWLILSLLLGTGIGILVNSRIDPVYEATTKVLVTRAGRAQAADFTAYLSDLQLTNTYLQLLTTKILLDTTGERIGVGIDPEDIKAKVIRDTQVIEINVENTDPQQAALIANSMVEVLVEQNELLQSNRYDSLEKTLQAQKTEIEAELQNLQRQIEQFNLKSLEEQKVWFEGEISSLQREETGIQDAIAQLGTINTPEKRLLFDQTSTRLERLQSLLSLYQENYNNLLLVIGNPVKNTADSTNPQLNMLTTTLSLYRQFYVTVLDDLESVRLARMQNTPNVVQIEPASLPEKPIQPRLILNTALAAILGLVLTAGAIFLIESLDDTLKTPKDIERVLGLPVLGFVAAMQYKDKDAKAIYVAKQPQSPIAEAFRVLRNNLEFESEQEPIHTLLVTSPGLAEGKSTVAVNLATVLAISGKQVAIVDADMHRPQIHQFFGIPNIEGFSNLFHDPGLVHSLGQNKTDLPYLKVITSGNLSTNATELWQSKKLDRILTELRTLAEMVVIDGPPSLMSDTQILAGKVDAVLLVIRPGKTTSKNAKASMEMFKRLGVRVIGTVMNRIPRNRGIYYDGYEFYSPYSNTKSYFSRKISQPEKEYTEESERNKR